MNTWPESTYRLQLHAGFTLHDAAAVVPYLADLGVTHVYCSPYLTARPGSTHGYDVVDHHRVNPELGGEAGLEAFVAALNGHGLKHIVDIVPNHVGVATNDNPWWNDVLAHGPASEYAKYFDIAWRGSPRPELHDKVLLPVLGAPYAEVLEEGELKLLKTGRGVVVAYYDRQFPLDPATGPDRTDLSADELHELLEKQHYRLAWWRTASDEINYRRFFDINDLAALAMEHEEVFLSTHELILRLIREGKLHGLRVDHPDGLYDPKAYFDRIQQHAGAGTYVVAEKILAPGEPLPEDWQVAGTTGYETLNVINNLFIDPAAADGLTRLYEDFTGDDTPFEDLVYEKKKLILEISLASELQMLAHRLDRLAQRDRRWRDFTHNTLRRALAETIACFPVYRTYVRGPQVTRQDIERIDHAIGRAVERSPRIEPLIFQFLQNLLKVDVPDPLRDDALAFVGKFQQLTAPATAKGIEDTAFYCHHRFVSLNEVGGEPGHFGTSADAAHAFFADRQRRHPHALTPLSTHDTKRAEDVRARLNVLSEIPEEWRARVLHWRALNALLNPPPPDEEYLLYQTLVGAFPSTPEVPDDLLPRIQAYMKKAMRESKLRTSWTNPNDGHERAVDDFIARILDGRGPFLADLRDFVSSIARFGHLNSLSQTLLRLTLPGAPDTYQGTELPDFSLVDPDNRRPVDYDRRRAMLRDLRQCCEDGQPHALPGLLSNLDDGRAKLFVTWQLLHQRRRHPGLFSRGAYEPLRAAGPLADHLFAFARRHEETTAVVVTQRFFARLGPAPDWSTTRLALPHPGPWLNIFTREELASPAPEDLFAHFPAAVLVSA